jgi:hypothetical protein
VVLDRGERDVDAVVAGEVARPHTAGQDDLLGLDEVPIIELYTGRTAVLNAQASGAAARAAVSRAQVDLSEARRDLDRKRIHLHTPVKTLGKHEVKIKLHAEVSVEMSFDVVSENPIEPVATEAPSADKSESRKASRKEAKE